MKRLILLSFILSFTVSAGVVAVFPVVKVAAGAVTQVGNVLRVPVFFKNTGNVFSINTGKALVTKSRLSSFINSSSVQKSAYWSAALAAGGYIFYDGVLKQNDPNDFGLAGYYVKGWHSHHGDMYGSSMAEVVGQYQSANLQSNGWAENPEVDSISLIDASCSSGVYDCWIRRGYDVDGKVVSGSNLVIEVFPCAPAFSYLSSCSNVQFTAGQVDVAPELVTDDLVNNYLNSDDLSNPSVWEDVFGDPIDEVFDSVEIEVDSEQYPDATAEDYQDAIDYINGHQTSDPSAPNYIHPDNVSTASSIASSFGNNTDVLSANAQNPYTQSGSLDIEQPLTDAQLRQRDLEIDQQIDDINVDELQDIYSDEITQIIDDNIPDYLPNIFNWFTFTTTCTGFSYTLGGSTFNGKVINFDSHCTYYETYIEPLLNWSLGLLTMLYIFRLFNRTVIS